MTKKCHHWYSNPSCVASRVFTYSLLGYTTTTTSVISPLSELQLIQKSEQRDGTEFDRISSHSKKKKEMLHLLYHCVCINFTS